MAEYERFTHPTHGPVEKITVDSGKYSFLVIEDTGSIVELQRYSEKWNREEGYLIPYNRAFGSLIFEMATLLKNQMDDGK